MSRHQRDILRAFRKAGLEVEVVEGRKHFSIFHNGQLVQTMSKGTKQSKRFDADLRRRIRRLQEGGATLCEKRFHRG